MFVCLLLDYAFDALMRVNISRILVRTPMHNVPQSVWMGLNTCAGTHIFCLLVLPTALWENFLVPICGTALKVHQGPAILLVFAVCSSRCKKIQHGWKWKLNWWLLMAIILKVSSIWSVFCLFGFFWWWSDPDSPDTAHPNRIHLNSTTDNCANQDNSFVINLDVSDLFGTYCSNSDVQKNHLLRRQTDTTQRTHEIWSVS